MIRIQTTYNYGCEQVERIVEVDDITALSAEERDLLIDTATGPMKVIREKESSEDMPAMDAMVGKLYVPDKAAYCSHTQNLVEHGLFEKDFIIKHNLELLRILNAGEGDWEDRKLVLKTLMRELGNEEEKCGPCKPDQG